MFQKTHRCVNCRRTLIIRKINPTFKTDYKDKAIEFVKEAKKRIGLRKGWNKLVTADKLSK